VNVLVTGANGLLGQKLVQLLQRDPGVHVIATGKRPLSITRGVFHKLDITDERQVQDAMEQHRPDVIIHTAAMTQVDACETDRENCWKTNVDAVGHLTRYAPRVCHFIHLSTDFIFDGSHGPLDELAQPNPVNFYGESKRAGEEVVQKSGLRWAILRTVLVYGVSEDMSRSNIVLWVKKSLEEGKQIQVVNDQWRTPTLAEDLAQACVLALKKNATGIFHISGEEMMTPLDIARQTAEFFALNASLIKTADSSTFTQPARRPPKTGFVITKAKTQLGYQPHSFTEGLALIRDQLAKRQQ
jgi:dTDP-4-dehydrorhamnose reductase